MSQIVYLVTCNVNGKFYVGITGHTLHVRWRRHVSDALAGSRMVFHHAIRKYGEEAFTAREIERHETRLEANLAEQRWIKHYDSMAGANGYNVDPGGTSHGVSPDVRRRTGAKVKAWWASLPPEEKARRVKLLLSGASPEVNARISATLKARNAAIKAGELDAFEEQRRANAEPNYGMARSYKPKPPRTAEQRKASAAKGRQAMRATITATLAAKSPEQKRAEKLKMWETRRAQLAAMTPEEREAKRLARKPRKRASPEEMADIIARAWDTRYANMAAGEGPSAGAMAKRRLRAEAKSAACPAPSLRINLLRLP